MSTASYNELYYQAASILQKAKEKKGTIKTLVYASRYKNVRQMYALVSECMKNREILEEIVSDCPKAFRHDPAIQGDVEVATVLLYDYLLGRKFGKAVGFRKLFQKYKMPIKSAVDKVLLQHGVKTLKEVCQMSNQEIVPAIPRYMRVNQIKSPVDSAIKELKAEDWEFVGRFTREEFQTRVLSLRPSQFGLDPILPDLFVFPPGTDLHDHWMTRAGMLVQQDRASCVPAHVLSPTPGSVVLDTCAAPGNKTSHLASLLHDNGRVIALDRDFKRLGTMTRLLSTSGATCVELIHQDFLTVEPTSEDAKNIQFILVDPSCSGSGMLNSQTNSRSSDMEPERIQTLKRFQISILKHALKFPNVQRVVYSTCSIHKEENEEVAEEVITQIGHRFQFVKIFPSWLGSRGLKEFPHSDCFLRLSPEQDLTQGFFVACFERVEGERTETEDIEGLEDEIIEECQGDTTESKGRRKSKKKKCKQRAVNNYNDRNFPNRVESEKELLTCEANSPDALTRADVSVTLKRKKRKRKHVHEEKIEGDSCTLLGSSNMERKKRKVSKSFSNKLEESDLSKQSKHKNKLPQESPGIKVASEEDKVKHKKKKKIKV